MNGNSTTETIGKLALVVFVSISMLTFTTMHLLTAMQLVVEKIGYDCIGNRQLQQLTILSLAFNCLILLVVVFLSAFYTIKLIHDRKIWKKNNTKPQAVESNNENDPEGIPFTITPTAAN